MTVKPVEVRGYFFIVAASVLWGTMGVLAKFTYGFGVQPDVLIALRLTAGFGTLFAVLLMFGRGSLRIERRDALVLLAFGVIGVTLQRLSYFYAVSLTTATVAAILFYTYPVFLSVYAWLFFGEKLTLWDALAIALTFVGVAFVVRAYDPGVLRADVVGIAFGLASSLFFVVYFVLVRRLRGRYASWTLTVCGDGIGALVLSPVVAVSFSDVVSFPWQVWLLVLVIAWFPSLLAYLLYSHAIKYVKGQGQRSVGDGALVSRGFFNHLRRRTVRGLAGSRHCSRPGWCCLAVSAWSGLISLVCFHCFSFGVQ